jgi:hypothetical protein
LGQQEGCNNNNKDNAEDWCNIEDERNGTHDCNDEHNNGNDNNNKDDNDNKDADNDDNADNNQPMRVGTSATLRMTPSTMPSVFSYETYIQYSK